MEGLSILKLGGSVITYKDRPLTPNIKAIEDIARAINKFKDKLILVHGGGSFGHYYAHIYNIGTEPNKASEEGVFKTRRAMTELNLIVTRSLEEQGIHTYSMPPSCIVDSRGVTKMGVKTLKSVLKCGLLPITYGDVLCKDGLCYVISGDRIVRNLSEALMPKRVVFTLDVDGIFKDGSRSEIFKELNVAMGFKSAKADVLDVTGGILNKLKEAKKIAELGIDVCFVNGLRPDTVLKALMGEDFYGTRLVS